MKNTFALIVIAIANCAHISKGTPMPDYQAIVSASDRLDSDKELDNGRKPVDFLKFIAPKPGERILELFAGRGYSTELLARAVSPTGVVYAQNSRLMLQKFLEQPFSERLKRSVNSKVVRVDKELDEPFAPEVKEVDTALMNVVYHDAVWLKADRTKMNSNIFSALKSGGTFIVCDSSAQKGHGIADVETLHRIDEDVVRAEIEKVGFVLKETSDILRNPQDSRDWNASPGAAKEKRGTSDRFCFKFVKPT